MIRVLAPTFALLTLASLVAVACGSDDSSNPGTTDTGGAAGAVAFGGSSDGGAGAGGAPPPDTFQWAKLFVTDPALEVNAVAADASGLVLVGAIQGTATFGTVTLTATGTSYGNAFVVKIDPQGNPLWGLVATGDQSAFEGVAIAANGDVVVTGSAYGDTTDGFTLGDKTVKAEVGAPIGDDEIVAGGGVVARLDHDGKIVWLNLIESSGPMGAGSVAMVGDQVAVAGVASESFKLTNGGDAVTDCTDTGCIFLGLYGADGTVAWSKHVEPALHRNAGAAVDHEVEIAGTPSGSIFLAVGGDTATAEAIDDAFQLVTSLYDATGAQTWTKSFPATKAEGGPHLSGVAADATGEYVMGYANGLTIGSGDIQTDYADTTYLLELSPAGDLSWVTSEPTGQPPYASTSLALGPGVLATFGNASLPDDEDEDDAGGAAGAAGGPTIEGGDDANLGLDLFDGATGKVKTLIGAESSSGTGLGVASAGDGTFYVVGTTQGPTTFGRRSTTGTGLYVARSK